MNMRLLIIAMAFVAGGCGETGNTAPAVDTTAKKAPDTTHAVTPDNFVKSEAPDATTHLDQGYCLSSSGNGKYQSPINIISSEAKTDASGNSIVVFHASVNEAENLGHTVQLDFGKGSTCTANGKSYTARQFHFHTPSEHLIDGVTYPMEMHVVTILDDSNQKSKPTYLVFGILFRMGKENKLIREFIHNIPKEEGEKDSIKPGTVNLDDLSDRISRFSKNHYFSYDGSLTTPPFTETVHWIVFKEIVEASPDQIMTIAKIEGNNARHIQSMYDRRITSR